MLSQAFCQPRSLLRSVISAGVLSITVAAAGQSFNSDALSAVANSFSPLTVDPIVLLHPALPIDPTYDPQLAAYQLSLSLQLDRTLKPVLSYSEAPPSLGDLYMSVLRDAQWATVPLIKTQRDSLAQVQLTLYGSSTNTPTAGYHTYLTLKAAYERALAAYQAASPDNITPPIQQQLDSAKRDLALRGHQNIYQPAEIQYSSLVAQKSYAWRDSDLAKVSAALVSHDGVDTFGTITQSIVNDFDNQPWSHISLKGTDLRHPASPSILPLQAARQQDHWWTFPVALQDGTGSCSSDLTDDNFTLEFDAVRIAVVRPWYDDMLWSSQSWRLPLQGIPISDGTIRTNVGSSPAIVNSLILVRNVVLAGPAIKACLPLLRSSVKQSLSVTFGPFQLAGTTTTTAVYLAPTLSQTSIAFFNPQLIGYGVTLLPKTPNPNNDFLWPTPQ